MPHARIKSIDTSKAEALPGVKAVITATTSRTCPRSSCRPARCWSTTATWCATSWRARRCSTTAMRSRRSRRPAPAIAKEALKLIEVEYEALPHVIDVVEAMARRRAAPARRHVHRGRRAGARQALERRQAGRVRARRHRGRLRAGRRRRRAHVRHQAGAPGLHRAARLRRQRLRGRPGGALVLARRAISSCARHCAKLLGMDVSQAARHRVRDRRRLRRQDRGLPRAAGARAVAQGAAARSRW